MTKRIVGLMIVSIGILLLLSNLDVVMFERFWRIIIALGIMAIGINGLIEKKRLDVILLILTIFGGLYLLANVGLIEYKIIKIIFWPLINILIGVSLLMGTSKKRFKNNKATSYIAVFSSVEDTNKNNEYENSEITAIFGGVEVDYRDIKIKDKLAYINVTVAFGGVTIFVPADVKITIKGMPIFGGVENKSLSKDTAKSELIINYTALCGGIEIKN